MSQAHSSPIIFAVTAIDFKLAYPTTAHSITTLVASKEFLNLC